MCSTAQYYIDKLQLEPHPEGGYYRQLFGNDASGKKDISTIYYMLTGSDKSAFHRLHGVTEIWYYHAGVPLNIYVIDTEGQLTVHNLSPDGISAANHCSGRMTTCISPEVPLGGGALLLIGFGAAYALKKRNKRTCPEGCTWSV